MIDPDDLPEPPIPTRAARAARLAALPYRCVHTGCHTITAGPDTPLADAPRQCPRHAGCVFGGAHPCLDEVGADHVDRGVDLPMDLDPHADVHGPGPFDVDLDVHAKVHANSPVLVGERTTR